ncbi:MAG TPA: peptidoglycan bridge formation glycyltransferase FemA/FemB family protein [Bacteroidales bacterium]|nr:peptidoglycan bridge formation glycyltransferase FemA/FemB family protein [Bacteroidales bacterium]
MNLLNNEEILLDKWKELIYISSFSSPFQTPEYYALFNSVPGLSAEAFAVEENNSISALVVVTIQKERGWKTFFSRRGIIYGGPVIKDNAYDALEFLLNHVSKRLKSTCIYIESRNFFDYTSYRNIFKKNGFDFMPWLNIKISVKNYDEIIRGISNSRLRQIRKALKNGVEIKEAENENDIILFFELLKKIYKKKIGKPLLPREFFIQFYKRNIGKYLLVIYRNIIIGGIMCAILSQKALYEFYVCGLDDEYKEQYPSVIATWAGIEYAHNNGMEVFDFMGAGNPYENYGVRDFKKRFGGEIVEYGRFIKINNSFLYKIGEFGLNIIKNFKF